MRAQRYIQAGRTHLRDPLVSVILTATLYNGVMRHFYSSWQKTKSCCHRMEQKNYHHSLGTDERFFMKSTSPRKTVAFLNLLLLKKAFLLVCI